MDIGKGARIVICAPGFPTSVQDPDKPFLFNHTRALRAAGWEVVVISPAFPGLPNRQIIDGIEVLRVRYAPRRLETLATTGAMYREARGLKSFLVIPMIFSMVTATFRQFRRGATLAYGHWWVPGGVVSVIAARLCRRPSLVHLHGSDAEIANTKPVRWMARLVLRFADARLAVSEELAKWGREVSGLKVEVLPMPLDFDLLPTPSPVPAEGHILAVGRLVPEKGFDILIDAVARFEESDRPELVIVGTGPERFSLAERATKAEVKLHLPGAVPPAELSDWYQRAQIVAVPSLREGFGLVAAEASAAGRAVVASAVGGMPEVVSHGHSGLLTQPGNVEELASALRNVDPQWGANGPELVSHLGLGPHGKIVGELFDRLTK